MEEQGNNNLNGYLGNVQLPSNPFSKDNDEKYQFQHHGEGMQAQADLSMAQYNAQVHESELLKQRQWALEDRDYNSPAELRKRLEAAGYNPSLMSGMVQTANQQVRGSSANSPSSSMNNMSGYASARSAAWGNVIDAGRSIISTMLAGKQMQSLDADINLKNSQSVKTLSESAKTRQDTKFASDLFQTQKNALEADLAGKHLSNQATKQQIEQVIPAQLSRMSKENEYNDAQIRQIAANIDNQTKLTNSQVKDIQQAIRESVQRINQSEQTVKNLAVAEANGWIDVKRNIIRQEVESVTKYADYARPYVDIVTEGISQAVGLSKAGSYRKVANSASQGKAVVQ